MLLAHLTSHEIPVLSGLLMLALGIGIGVGLMLAWQRLAHARHKEQDEKS